MAKMRPSHVAEDNPRDAEKRIFGKIENGLSGEWTVLHSLGLAHHKRKRWAEADFVLVGPRGVFVGEVKGGRVERNRNGWVFINRNGERNTKREGPYDQAGGCAGALNRYLREKLDDRVDVRWAVMLPDIEWNESDPGAPLTLTYDGRDEHRPIKDFVDQIADYWDQKNFVSNLDQSMCDRIVHRLRPEFDLHPSLPTQITGDERSLLALTEDQYKIIDGLADNQRVMVKGGAGTGKTMIALEEARRHERDGKAVLLTCATKALGASMGREFSGGDVVATNFHAYMMRIVRVKGLEHKIPSEASDDDRMRNFLPRVAKEAIESSEDLRGAFDVLIIDEAQDLLLDAYMDVFDVLLSGGLEDGRWRMFYDPNQDLFQSMAKPMVNRLREGPGFVSYRLTKNCRNTAHIATFVAQAGGLKTDEVLLDRDTAEVEKVFCRDNSDMRSQVSKHINDLVKKRVKHDQIVLLSPVTRQTSCLADGLEDGPEIIGLDDGPGSGNSILYATIGSFKGLERSIVLLVDIWDLEDRRNLYVGSSRARARLTVFLGDFLKGSWTEAVQHHAELMFEEE